MLRRQLGDEFFIRVGSFASQFVIEMHHTQHDAQLFPRLQQEQQQRHRIRPA
jgi:hypothetical protein